MRTRRSPGPSRPATLPAVAAAGALCAGLLAGCASPEPNPAGPTGPATSAPTPAADAPVVVDARRPGPGLLPTDVADETGMRVADLLYSGLMRFDPKGRAVPEIAESVTSTDDRLWTVRITPGWTFSDGTPVTSRSFVDAWNAAARPGSDRRRAYAFSSVAGFEEMRAPGADRTTRTRLSGLRVVDDDTFTITLARPEPGFAERLADVAFAPLPPRGVTDPRGFAREPVGTGPYRLIGQWPPSSGEIVLRPNGAYRGVTPAHNQGLRFRVTEPSTALASLTPGRLDVVHALPPDTSRQERDELRERSVNQPVGVVQSIVFPVNRAPWSGPAGRTTRQAISMAIDRDELAQDVLADTVIPATDLAAPVVEGHSKELCGRFCRHDPQAAAQLLRSARLAPPRLTLAVDASSPTGRAWADAACAQVTDALGGTCTPHAYPDEVALRQAVESGAEKGPYVETWRMRRPVLADFLAPRFQAGSPENGSGYADAAAQTALRDAAAQPLPEQPAAYAEAERLVVADLPVVPLWSVNATTAWTQAVSHVRVGAFGSPVYPEITRTP